MKEKEQKATEPTYQIILCFDHIEQSTFGELRKQTMRLILPKSEAKAVENMYLSHRDVLTIHLADGVVRHVNFDNILYLDIKELK